MAKPEDDSHRIAHVWERVLAGAVDSAIAFYFFIPIGLILPKLRWSLPGLALVFSLIHIDQLIYYIVVEGMLCTRTPGKRIVGLSVLSQTREPPTRAQYTKRNLLRPVDLLHSLYLVGILSMATDRLERRVGDKIAGTIVVKDKSRKMVLGSAVIVLLPALFLSPVLTRTYIRPPTLPGHPRIETEVISPVPILLAGSHNFSVVLQIANRGDAQASQCRIELVGPEHVHACSEQQLLLGDLKQGESIRKTIEFCITNAEDQLFILVLRVSSQEGATSGSNIPVRPT